MTIKRRELSLEDLLEMKRIVSEEIERQNIIKEEKKQELDEITESVDLSLEEEQKVQESKAIDGRPNQIELVESPFVHRDTLARNDTSRSKYNFADDSDSDDEGAMLTKNSDFYRGDELDLDQKNLRSTLALGSVLNIDQVRSVEQGKQIYLTKLEKQK